MSYKLKCFLLVFFHSNFLLAQWNYPNYNVEFGYYNDCEKDQMCFKVPGNISTQADLNNTSIFFNLNSSDIKSKEIIILNSGILIEANCTSLPFESYTLLEIDGTPSCGLVLMNSNSGIYKKYDKVEIGIQPPVDVMNAINNFFNNSNQSGPKINPYNPDHNDADFIDVVATFYSPLGNTHNRIIYGFFYRDYSEDLISDNWHEKPTNYPFRIRFAFPDVGYYRIKVELFSHVSNATYFINSSCVQTPNNDDRLLCTLNPDKEGPLEVGLHQHFLRFKDTHKSFFGVGRNLGYPRGLWESNTDNLLSLSEFKSHQNLLSALADAKGNYARILCLSQTYGPEWLNLNVYDSGEWPIGSGKIYNRQQNMHEFDQIIDTADKRDVYLQVVIDMGQYYSNRNHFNADPLWDLRSYWPLSPYKIAGFNNSDDFFLDFMNSNSVAKKQYLKRIRYIFSRWGYSNNIANFEVMNEVEGNDYYSEIPVSYFINEIISYSKYTLGYTNHLYSCSYSKHSNCIDKPTGGNPLIDILDSHDYADRKDQNIVKRADATDNKFNKSWANQHKPAIFGEIGCAYLGRVININIDECTSIGFHNAIWATSFMGNFATGLNWLPWNKIQEFQNITQVALFFRDIDFESNKFSPFRWRDGNLIGGLKNNLLECFGLTNRAGTKSIGWIHNATAYWYNVQPSCSFRPDDDDRYSSIQRISGKKYKIKKLQLLRKYSLDEFRPENNTLYNSRNLRANIFGELNPKCFDMFNYRNDYAFKVHPYGQNFRLINDDVEVDTLSCSEDTIEVSGIYSNDSLGILNYLWLVDSTDTYTGNHPTIIFQTNGIHLISLIVSDSTGWADSLAQYVYLPSCDEQDSLSSFRKRLNDYNVIKEDSITLLPNPAHNIISLAINFSFTKAKITIYNSIGKIFLCQIIQSNTTAVQLDEPPGLYICLIEIDGLVIYRKFLKL